MHHVDGVLGHGIEGGHRFCVGLKGALGDNQVGKLGRDVDVRTFESAALHRAQAGCSRRPDGRRAAGQRSRVVAVPERLQALVVGNIAHRQLAYNHIIVAVAVRNGDGSVRADGEALIVAGRIAVLQGSGER